ncbi:hypothetical protein Tco_1057192 [Tanacetum coccineum]|uniref:Uncharacterized protein n=1 Tax=Tanacetum coccineum TaxID=301880 RepID=A0ABQ5H4N5_9ASTR
MKNDQSSQEARTKNQRAFFGGTWSDSGEDEEEKTIDETCLVAQASNKVEFSKVNEGSNISISALKIRDIESQKLEGKVVQLGDDGKLLKPMSVSDSGDDSSIRMVLPDNQGSSPKSVFDDKAFEDSSNESDFDVNLYLNDEEDNVVVPQTPSEEVRTRIYNTRIPPLFNKRDMGRKDLG